VTRLRNESHRSQVRGRMFLAVRIDDDYVEQQAGAGGVAHR
jgi:hypothetical protein